MQSIRPLFHLDPGWPFVLAGLALLVAVMLIPAQRELHDLRNEARKVDAEELRIYGRLQAYDRFLSGLQARDPEIVRRLAIAQLNLVPKGEESFLLTPGMNQTVAQWIDESVPTVSAVPESYPDTLLGRFALGPNRLWLVASAVFLLFVGLVFGPDTPRSTALESETLPRPKPEHLGTSRVETIGATSAALAAGVLVVDESDDEFDESVIDVEWTEERLRDAWNDPAPIIETGETPIVEADLSSFVEDSAAPAAPPEPLVEAPSEPLAEFEAPAEPDPSAALGSEVVHRLGFEGTPASLEEGAEAAAEASWGSAFEVVDVDAWAEMEALPVASWEARLHVDAPTCTELARAYDDRADVIAIGAEDAEPLMDGEVDGWIEAVRATVMGDIAAGFPDASPAPEADVIDGSGFDDAAFVDRVIASDTERIKPPAEGAD